MKHIMKKCPILLFCIALGGTLNACGRETEPQIQTQEASTAGTAVETSEIKIESPKEDNESESLSSAAFESSAFESVAPIQSGYRIIENQTFEVTLEPLGKVIFASYEPDGQQSSLKDALFEIQC